MGKRRIIFPATNQFFSYIMSRITTAIFLLGAMALGAQARLLKAYYKKGMYNGTRTTIATEDPELWKDICFLEMKIKEALPKMPNNLYDCDGIDLERHIGAQLTDDWAEIQPRAASWLRGTIVRML